jgi:cation transport regulator ChaC
MSSALLSPAINYPAVSVPAMFKQANSQQPTSSNQQDEEKVWLFGYGSLMNPQSLDKSFVDKTPIAPEDKRKVTLTGWQRVWDAFCKVTDKMGNHVNLVFLNIQPSNNPATELTGVALHVTKEQAEAIDDRELAYHFVDVGKDIQRWETFDGKRETKPEHLYVAVADEENRLPAQGRVPNKTLIPQSYVDTVQEAFKMLNISQDELHLDESQVKVESYDYSNGVISPASCDSKPKANH